MMRKFIGLTALALGLALASSAYAQQPSSSGSSPISSILNFPKTMNINVQPNITNNSPMSYVNSNAPIGTTIYKPSNNGSAFNLRMNQFFYQPKRTNYIASTTTFGVSNYPTPAQMQASAPSYFRAFQMYRAQPIQP
ncbi:MAG: hypothetical protein ACYC3I_22530 [Gemmataceae bacterium]